jgi:hypothetical protein
MVEQFRGNHEFFLHFDLAENGKKILLGKNAKIIKLLNRANFAKNYIFLG